MSKRQEPKPLGRTGGFLDPLLNRCAEPWCLPTGRGVLCHPVEALPIPERSSARRQAARLRLGRTDRKPGLLLGVTPQAVCARTGMWRVKGSRLGKNGFSSILMRGSGVRGTFASALL